MADLYQSLISAAPTQEQKQMAIAEALRRRRGLGELGVLSNDEAIGKLGANLVDSSDSYAKQINDTRLKEQDDARTAQYYAMQNQWQQADQSHRKSALEQAMKIAQMNDARMREIAALQRQAREDALKDKESLKLGESLDKRRHKLSADLDKSGLPRLWQAFNRVEAMNASSDDLSGVGGPANTVLGKWSSEGAANQNTIADLRNAIIAAGAGKAITQTEMKLMLDELALNPWDREETFRKAVTNIRSRINEATKNWYAGAGKDVVQSYKDEGGYLWDVDPESDPYGDRARLNRQLSGTSFYDLFPDAPRGAQQAAQAGGAGVPAPLPAPAQGQAGAVKPRIYVAGKGWQ